MDYYRQNELPETVKRYKTYTDQFQAWLLKTGIQRGVELANVVADQAKKKKSKAGYRIPLQKQEQLVNAIAATNIPLADTSGINDLGDAIRSRREVTQYHKHNNTADSGHEYFNGSLEALMASLKVLVPGLRKARDRKNDTTTLVFIQLPTGPKTGQDEQDDLLEKMRRRDKSDMDDGGQPQQTLTSRTRKMPTPETNALTAAEERLRREFLILCFLYNLNRIRDILFEVWVSYHKGIVNVITAALVSDLTQDHVHQNVKALVEELDLLPGELASLIHQLFDKIKAAPNTEAQNSAPPPTEKTLRHLFGLDAAALIKTYITKTRTAGDSADDNVQEHPLLLFLRFFDVIRKGGLKLPRWDHFTGEMLLHQSTSQDYLPFGLTIVLDIQEAVREDYRRILRDLTEHGLDIARCIRCHVDYEDRMWAKGTKPDYMCREEIKFSTILLNPLNRLLEWLQELLDSREKPMTASVFITVHSTLAGLSMWHFNQIYHSTAVAKIQWFIIGMAHLYNAASQMGGLNIQWPDLDYLIEMYGVKVMFRGNPPTHPNDFLNRYLISTNTSSRIMASDFRHTSKFLPQVSREIGAERGLQPELPLEAKIADYYGPNPDDNRWLRRHAVFNYLYRRSEATEDTPDNGSDEATQNMKDLQDVFANLATKITPPQPKRKGKNKSRVRKPDFDKQGETHANLLGTMKSELQHNEVHSNFDFLSFYRRAYDLVLRIRGEILMSDQVQRFRAKDMNTDLDPPNFQLITDLFLALRIEPKTKKEEEAEAKEGPGQQLSTKVIPLMQIQRVAEMMQDLTRGKGDVELKHAELRGKGDWEGLKASYAADEAERQTCTVDDTVVQVEKEAVLEVAEDEVEVEVMTPLHIDDGDHRIECKFEADGDSELGPVYTLGNQLPGPEHTENNPEDMWNESPTAGTTDTIVNTQDDTVPFHQEDGKNITKRKHEADENSEISPAHVSSPRDQTDDAVDDSVSQHVLAPIARKVNQSQAPDDQIHQMANTACPTALAAPPLTSTQPTPHPPSPLKTSTRPKGLHHCIPYFRTTLRKSHITAIRPAHASIKTGILALSDSKRRRGFFRRTAGIAGKHHVAFRCYARCSLARALCGRQTRLQRQMASAVAELRKRERRDSAELEKVWAGVGGEDGGMGRFWETESEGRLD